MFCFKTNTIKTESSINSRKKLIIHPTNVFQDLKLNLRMYALIMKKRNVPLVTKKSVKTQATKRATKLQIRTMIASA